MGAHFDGLGGLRLCLTAAAALAAPEDIAVDRDLDHAPEPRQAREDLAVAGSSHAFGELAGRLDHGDAERTGDL